MSIQWGSLITAAHKRIGSSVLETPLESASDLVPALSVGLLLKREDLQQTGSFKLRGATNKVLSLTPSQAAAE